MPDSKTVPPRAMLIQVFLCALWALGQVAIKSVGDQISPLFHAGIRSLGAVLVLLIWVHFRRINIWQRDGSLVLGIVIGVLFGLEFLFLFAGFSMTSASRGTLLLYTASFFVAIGAHFFVPNDKLKWKKFLGLVCAFAGVALVFFDRPTALNANGTSANSMRGDIYCLIAAFLWGATTVVVKATRLRYLPPEKNILYQLAVSVVVLLGGSYIHHEQGIIESTPLLWSVLALGILVIASASYLTWFWLVSKYRATTLHAFTFLTPIFGVVFAALLLNEPVSGALLAAVALVAAGIVFVNQSQTS
jgi:drug/metabolite transporter (DMT)-like permease